MYREGAGSLNINHKKLTVIVIIHYLIALFVRYDSVFFQYTSAELQVKNMIIMKILFLPFLWIIYRGLFFLLHSKKNEPNIFYIYIFIFTMYACIWLVIRPGTYYSMALYEEASVYKFDAWQNIYTSVWTILCLQLCPSIQWSLLFQVGVAAFCYAFLIDTMMRYEDVDFAVYRGKAGIVKKAFLIIPFISLPVVYHSFANFRMAIYPAFECLLMAIILKIDQGKKNYIYFLPLLVGIVAVMRTEGCYWIIFIIIFYIIWCKKGITNLKSSMITVTLCIIVMLFMNNWQSKELNAQYDNDGARDYALTTIMCPGVELIRNATEDDQELLNDIAKVINIQVIKDNPERDGGSLTYGGGLVKSSSEYSAEEYTLFKKSLIKLALRHPDIVLKERMKWVKIFLTIDKVDDYYGETIGGINRTLVPDPITKMLQMD